MNGFEIGQEVRYVGTHFPDYTNKVYQIKRFLSEKALTLSLSGGIRLEGSPETFGMSFLAGIDEIEKI